MLTDSDLRTQLPFVLNETSLDFLGEKYSGKVRDNYTCGDVRYLITSDRLSCFDVVVTTVPFKGEVLNRVAAHWFARTNDILPNHLLDMPDPAVMVVKNCEVLQIEVIVRAYITGSAWRDYEAGREISGVRLAPGLRASQKLPEPILTPSVKAPKGQHDEPISEREILAGNLVPAALWEQIREAAFGLFAIGSRRAEERGLILVDTKYEFGLYKGKLTLVDEIHTLDSSRYWIRATYQDLFEKGAAPQMLDKEPTRQWLLSKGYKGEGKVPEFTDDHRVEISRHYIDSAEKIMGETFTAEVGPTHDRIERRLKGYRLPA